MDPLMTIWVFFIGCTIGIIGGVILSYRTAVTPLHRTVSTLTSHQEDFEENMKYYPYNTDMFRFIGDPVDGIQFEPDVVLFVRLKTGNKSRTVEQDHIKHLLEQGKVGWFEYTIK